MGETMIVLGMEGAVGFPCIEPQMCPLGIEG